jgi:hypothetical protein
MNAYVAVAAAQFDVAVTKTAELTAGPATLYVRDGDSPGVKLAKAHPLAKSTTLIGRSEWLWEPPHGPDEGTFNQFDYEDAGFLIVFDRARDADTVRAAIAKVESAT